MTFLIEAYEALDKIREGRPDDPQDDAVMDAMDVLWRGMDQDELDILNTRPVPKKRASLTSAQALHEELKHARKLLEECREKNRADSSGKWRSSIVRTKTMVESLEWALGRRSQRPTESVTQR